MPDGTGYIRKSKQQTKTGRIHVCAGFNVGEDVAFAFESCSVALQTIFKEQDISIKARCPPPPKSVRVSFDIDIQNDMEAAVNVTLI